METDGHDQSATGAEWRHIALVTAAVIGILTAVAALVFAWPSETPRNLPHLRDSNPAIREVERKGQNLWVTMEIPKQHTDHAYVASAGAMLNAVTAAIAGGAKGVGNASMLQLVYIVPGTDAPGGTAQVRLMRLRLPMTAVKSAGLSQPGQFDSLELADQISIGSPLGAQAIESYCNYYRHETPQFCELALRYSAVR